ncbi:MAG TPA: M28 family peptidase [Haliangiales bacterium]|nr:M28 family peptidase [Haliangiales bacterium]
MLTKQASRSLAKTPLPQVSKSLAAVAEEELRGWVERLAVPRHFEREPEENKNTAVWIAAQFQSWGYPVELQGSWWNVVALPKNASGPLVLVCAHYDSVGGCAGADDNASAVAAMLGCAKACAAVSPRPDVGFVSFNREEDGMLGSQDFVQWLASSSIQVKYVHVLEMVGYASDEAGSQRIPPGLPVRVSDQGNFLALLANRKSYRVLDALLVRASTYLPGFPAIGLRVSAGLEKFFPVLLRSDHAPFWQRRMPATLWTDTSEFRNPFYHQPGDKPHTLNYRFLLSVTQLLVASVLEGQP